MVWCGDLGVLDGRGSTLSRWRWCWERAATNWAARWELALARLRGIRAAAD